MNLRLSSVRFAAVMMLSTLVWAGTPAWAADEKPAAEKEAKPSAEGKAKKEPVDYRGPLPFYYAKVVSPDQKEKLYSVTQKYESQIKELQTKLRELEQARLKEIDALLTPEQLARVKELREEATKARGPKKPAEGSEKPKSEGDK